LVADLVGLLARQPPGLEVVVTDGQADFDVRGVELWTDSVPEVVILTLGEEV
jgi:hypothetical protein